MFWLSQEPQLIKELLTFLCWWLSQSHTWCINFSYSYSYYHGQIREYFRTFCTVIIIHGICYYLFWLTFFRGWFFFFFSLSSFFFFFCSNFLFNLLYVWGILFSLFKLPFFNDAVWLWFCQMTHDRDRNRILLLCVKKNHFDDFKKT